VEPLVVELPDLEDVGVPIYANITHVSYTPYDFRITFSLLSTPHDASDDRPFTPKSPPRAVAEIVLPAAAVASLADLLRARLEAYTGRFGAPSPAPPR
jgi:hypothetical protein